MIAERYQWCLSFCWPCWTKWISKHRMVGWVWVCKLQVGGGGYQPSHFDEQSTQTPLAKARKPKNSVISERVLSRDSEDCVLKNRIFMGTMSWWARCLELFTAKQDLCLLGHSESTHRLLLWHCSAAFSYVVLTLTHVPTVSSAVLHLLSVRDSADCASLPHLTSCTDLIERRCCAKSHWKVEGEWSQLWRDTQGTCFASIKMKRGSAVPGKSAQQFWTLCH